MNDMKLINATVAITVLGCIVALTVGLTRHAEATEYRYRDCDKAIAAHNRNVDNHAPRKELSITFDAANRACVNL